MEGSQVISNPCASSTNIQYNAWQTGHAPLQLTAAQYDAREGFAHRTTAGLSICQFILGVTAISLGVAAIIIKCELSHIGTGIWCGCFFSITGIIGIISAAKNKTGAIIAFMVLSIISASVFSACLFVISIVAATREYNCLYCRNPEGRLMVDVLLVAVAVAEAAVAIVASAICCRAVCCNRSQNSMHSIPMQGQTVQHRAPMEQSHVIGNPYASSGSTQFHRRQIVMQQQVYTIPSPTVPHNIETPTSQQGTCPAVQQPQPMQFQQKSQQHPMLQQPAQSPMSPQQSQQFEQRGTPQYPQHVQQPTKLLLQQQQSQPLHWQQSPPRQQLPPMQRTQPQLLQRPPLPPLQSKQSPPPSPLQELHHVDTTQTQSSRQQQRSPRDTTILGGASPCANNISASSPPPECYVVDDMEAHLVENESHS